MRRSLPFVPFALVLCLTAALAFPPFCRVAEADGSPSSASEGEPAGNTAGEAANLGEVVQLTFPDEFVKAGEAYLSPDGERMIFQATPTPPEGEAAEPFYSMYVAEVVWDGAGEDRAPVRLETVRRISPPGTANTCGWFHPTDPDVVIFATTIGEPSESTPPGYQRASGRYRWMFPPEMRIVRCRLSEVDGTADALEVLIEGDAYIAEGSLSPDGRHLVYCSLETNEGDLYVHDLRTGRTTAVVTARGYDGGPFFSPDGRRICYRSDRTGTNLLQLYVADLRFDVDGSVIGIEREHQLTFNEHVNWAPYWHPDGRHLIYGTSAMGHHNYELFICDADPGDLPGSDGPVRYGTRNRRVTHAGGADVLPVFSHDGRWLVWTGQRDETGTSQVFMARWKMPLDPIPTPQPYSR